MTSADLVSLVAAGTVILLGLAVLAGYLLGHRDAGPTVARLAGDIDRLERKLQLEAAANDRLAALVPRTIKLRDNRFDGRRPVLEINGVVIAPRRTLEVRDEMLLGRLALHFQMEPGDWPVDELMAAQPDPAAPSAAAGLTRLRELLAGELDRDQPTERPSPRPPQPVS